MKIDCLYGIGNWCNGSTAVFGAVRVGSSPAFPTKGVKASPVRVVSCTSRKTSGVHTLR